MTTSVDNSQGSAPKTGAIIAEVAVEILITSAPIAALAFAFALRGPWWTIFDHEEWIFVAGVLFAQIIVKLMRAMASNDRLDKSKLILVCVLLALVFLVPCIVLLAFKVFEMPQPSPTESSPNNARTFHLSQLPGLAFFFLSCVAFVICGGVAVRADAVAKSVQSIKPPQQD